MRRDETFCSGERRLRRRTAITGIRNSVERAAHRRKAPSPTRVGFVGADACAKLSPPSSPCSTEISLRPRTQLRQTFARRRSAITGIRNSVERGAHRRKPPSPTRVGFAGADACAKRSPPSSPRSTEISLRPRTQLRQTFARRRSAITGDLNSVERGAHRRKAPSPTRVGFAGAGACAKRSPPSSPRSTEISLRPRTQLRQTFARRRSAVTGDLNSVEKGAHRRKPPSPTRVGFAGAGTCAKRSPPSSPCTTEISLCPRTQLRQTFASRRSAITGIRNSVERGVHRRKPPSPVSDAQTKFTFKSDS